MATKKTLGGDRLGSGSKMKVELKAYERSTHDLSYIWRSSMSPGTLVPFMVQVALPGDTFDIDLMCEVLTHPTLGPLFGSFKVQLDVFEAPIRLYHSALMQNSIAIGNSMSQVLLPQMVNGISTTAAYTTISSNPDNIQMNPSCLLSYLGLRGWGLNNVGGTPNRAMNAIPLLAYWEIYKNYYANKQENNGAMILPPSPTATGISGVTVNGLALTAGANTPPGILLSQSGSIVITFSGTAPDLTQILFNTNVGQLQASNLATWTATATTYTTNTGTYGTGIYIYGWQIANPNDIAQITTFPLINIDNQKAAILQSVANVRLQLTSANALPYGPCISGAFTLGSTSGLGLKTYQSDLFNNWMQTTWYNSIRTSTSVSTAGNTFTLDALILARKTYDLLLRIAVSGGTYHDWIEAAYSHEPYTICQTPIYHGGLSKELVFQQVVSTAQAGPQPLGTLSGKGTMTKKHKGGRIRIKVNEPSYLMGIVSLTPRLDYSQGNAWHMYALGTMDDLHKPGLDGIGFQPLITEQLAWWDTHWNGASWAQNTAGYQPAWVNYMTEVNRNYGNFAIPNNEMFMTLNRRYAMNVANGQIQDLTTYVDPSHYNFIFAQTSMSAQNFWTQIAVDIQARRKMSAKIMPNL